MTNYFNYELVGTGWAKFSINNENNSGVEFVFSYLADPLSDLLESLNKLIKNKSSFERINFPQEPGELFLFLKNKNDTIALEIYYADDLTSEFDNEKILNSFKKIYSDNDNLTNFSRLVYEEIKKLLHKYGEDGYREKWVEYDFPMKQFKILEELQSYA